MLLLDVNMEIKSSAGIGSKILEVSEACGASSLLFFPHVILLNTEYCAEQR